MMGGYENQNYSKLSLDHTQGMLMIQKTLTQQVN
jgi:hypothetical protein